ncbi:tetratricopeptide repeat protein [Pseudomonas fluorescens]|nr:tetratricopeptide repeat protein [Pseudomonas fluorescens]
MANKNSAITNLQPVISALSNGNSKLGEMLVRKILKKQPRNAEALYLCGVACSMKGRAEEAEALLLQALSLRGDARYWLKLALTRQNLDNDEGAGTAYRQCLLLQPGNAQAANNLGSILKLQYRFTEAEEHYRNAIAHNPNYIIAYQSLGTLLCEQSRNEPAISILVQGMSQAPHSDILRGLLAWALSNLSRYAEAAQHLKEAQQWSDLQRMLRCLGDWRELATVDRAVLQRFINDPLDHPKPWPLTNLPQLTPQMHREAGRRWAEHFLGRDLAKPSMAFDPEPGARLRIGYLSCDFYDHATLHLLIGVLESHDHEKVQVQLFDHGPQHDDSFTRRLTATGLPRHDLRDLDDEAAARLIAGQRLHILVDLKGYTTGARLGICARRPAPIIVNWLGYPGSIGHPKLADYLIGDPTVTPPEHAEHFSETLALLPDCYQPNDRLRPLAKTIDRIGAGLPETGLVFCSFNQLLKLNPAQLDLWCRLLCETPGSLLWMVDPDSEDARANLSREIEQRGVSLERLIFAPRLKQDEHLARLALADIALDSFPCTSHTTASDALWVGVPLLTRIGTTFVSRVAASLLHAHGFDELVAEDDEEYFEKVRALVQSPDRRADLRQRLESARLNSPLFDTSRFTKNLEALFIAIWEQHGRDTGRREPIIIQN